MRSFTPSIFDRLHLLSSTPRFATYEQQHSPLSANPQIDYISSMINSRSSFSSNSVVNMGMPGPDGFGPATQYPVDARNFIGGGMPGVQHGWDKLPSAPSVSDDSEAVQKLGRIWSREEDEIIRDTVAMIGPKWAAISRMMQDRTPSAVRNRHGRLMAMAGAQNDSSSFDESYSGFDCEASYQPARMGGAAVRRLAAAGMPPSRLATLALCPSARRSPSRPSPASCTGCATYYNSS